MGVKRPVSITCKLFDYQGMTDSEYVDAKVPIKYAVECLNLIKRGNKLISQGSVVEAYSDSDGFAPTMKCVKMFPYNGKSGSGFELLILDTKNNLYTLKRQWNNTFVYNKILEGVYIESACEFRLESKNLLMLSTGGVILYSYDGTNLQQHMISQSPSKLTNHFERLFGVATDGYTIVFSKELEPYNWKVSLDDGGYINVGIGYGKILRLISFNEYLYCFAHNGILRISAYAQQSEFSIKRLDVDTGGIYGDSIASCKDRIMYLSSKGLNVFDGYNNRILYPELTPIFSQYDYFNGRYSKNKYYLLASKEKRHVLYVFDITQGSYSAYDGFIADSICEERFLDNLGDVLLFEGKNVNGKVVPFYRLDTQSMSDTQRVWRSGKVDFSHKDKPKLIRQIRGAGGRYSLIIYNGIKETFVEMDGENRVNVNLRGQYFEFRIISSGRTEISSPILEVYVIDE